MYRVIHVDTEGGPFVAGGNGTYINALMTNQVIIANSTELPQAEKKKIALVLPAYRPMGKPFSQENKKKITFFADIYTNNGNKETVELCVWHEKKGRVEFFYLEPDKNHFDYFTTQADEKGNISGIRTIPIELTPLQENYKAIIKNLETELFHDPASNLYNTRKNLLKENLDEITLEALQNYAKQRVMLQDTYEKLQAIYEGRVNEISLYMRNAHFHEISGAFINYWTEKHSVDVIHTHDYGNTARYINKDIAKVNTFHSDPKEGLLPYYIQEQLGENATQRGDGISQHHLVYAVSQAYEKWLKNPKYSNAAYTIPMSNRGRVNCVTSVANTSLHGFHRMLPHIGGYCTKNEFDNFTICAKKQLAKIILADQLKTLNPNFEFDPNKKTILFLSRISPAKGSDFIEDIIKFSQKNNCNVIICGFHGFEGSRSLIERLQKDYPTVPIIIGKEDQDRLGCLHRAASDIGVGVSLEEAYGLAYSECLCYGSLCVISDVGGSRDAVLDLKICAVIFALFKGFNKHYTFLQGHLCDLKNSLQKPHPGISDEDHKSQYEYREMKKICDQNEENANNFLIDQTRIRTEVPKARDSLIRYLKNLLPSANHNLSTLRELARHEKNLRQLYDTIDSINKLDKPRTTEAMVKALQKALNTVTNTPEIAEHIFDTAHESFSQMNWAKKVEEQYKCAISMNQTRKTFRSTLFKDPFFSKTDTSEVKSDNINNDRNQAYRAL